MEHDNSTDALAAHWAALEAQVAALTIQHGAPVAVNYQSGGYVAYATWLVDDRLFGYSLSSGGPASLEFDLTATLLSVQEGRPAWDESLYSVDVLGDLHTVWHEDDASHHDGVYVVYDATTNRTRAYGIGVAL